MRSTLFVFLAICLSGLTTLALGQTRTIDDGYTISQRYEGYQTKYPLLSLPETRFVSGQSVWFDRRYKKIGARELRIDVFLPTPKAAKSQAILLIHGGGWRSGSKSHFYALANRLAQKGYVVFIPEYRLSPEAQYPAGLNDINDALVWAKSMATELRFAPNTIAIGGASSGGQMAALLAYSARKPLFKSNPEDDTSVNAMIDLDGVLDFTTPGALKFENAAGASSAAGLWLGGAFEQIPERWREASATSHIGPQSPPSLIISSGHARFTEGKITVFSEFKKHAIRYDYYEFTNAPHDIWLFEPYLTTIVDKVDQFLKPQNKMRNPKRKL